MNRCLLACAAMFFTATWYAAGAMADQEIYASWERHVIEAGVQGAREQADGDLDVITTEEQEGPAGGGQSNWGLGVVWYENPSSGKCGDGRVNRLEECDRGKLCTKTCELSIPGRESGCLQHNDCVSRRCDIDNGACMQ